MSKVQYKGFIRGEIRSDYFQIVCNQCNKIAYCEYLGWDPAVPHFRATCKKCSTVREYKFGGPYWKGLPSKPD